MHRSCDPGKFTNKLSWKNMICFLLLEPNGVPSPKDTAIQEHPTTWPQPNSMQSRSIRSLTSASINRDIHKQPFPEITVPRTIAPPICHLTSPLIKFDIILLDDFSIFFSCQNLP